MKNDQFLANRLDKRSAIGNFRTIGKSLSGVDFSSNDYLGLAQNIPLQKRITHRWDNEAYKWSGGTGSRLLTGNHQYYEELESLLCRVFRAQSTLVFNSGYSANTGLISSIADKNDLVLLDELSHACIKEGVRLTNAKSYSFRHNSTEDLRRLLMKNDIRGRKFVIIESLYSMDGDFAPIKEVMALCDELDAYLIVDEAHTTGVYGKGGSGWLTENGWHNKVFARIYTFGKAMGGHGACVAGSKTLIDYLINFSRPFIYTTSLPPHTLVSLIESFDYLNEHPHLQTQLQSNIGFYQTKFHEVFEEKSMSHTAIQPYMIGDNGKTMKMAEHLLKNGIEAMAIKSPTVKKGTERLRICLHSFNTQGEILKLIEALQYPLED